jgi:hypothetical protein
MWCSGPWMVVVVVGDDVGWESGLVTCLLISSSAVTCE